MLADTPLLTGQRVLDALFPAVLGGAFWAGLGWEAIGPFPAAFQSGLVW
jgi:vacuolar-type H+-ATPase catalytic subunit A/Vma1